MLENSSRKGEDSTVQRVTDPWFRRVWAVSYRFFSFYAEHDMPIVLLELLSRAKMNDERWTCSTFDPRCEGSGPLASWPRHTGTTEIPLPHSSRPPPLLGVLKRCKMVAAALRAWSGSGHHVVVVLEAGTAVPSLVRWEG